MNTFIYGGDQCTKRQHIPKGRQIAFMISDKIRGTSEAILDISELMKVALKSDNVQDYDTKLDFTVITHEKR